MPKVSIIVPVYNVERYIVRSMDSLVNQTLNSTMSMGGQGCHQQVNIQNI